MPRQVTSAFRNFANTIREFTIAQRTVAIIGLAVLVLGVIALGMWVTKPSYTPLFSGLSGEDANTLVEQLRADGEPLPDKQLHKRPIARDYWKGT